MSTDALHRFRMLLNEFQNMIIERNKITWNSNAMDISLTMNVKHLFHRTQQLSNWIEVERVNTNRFVCLWDGRLVKPIQHCVISQNKQENKWKNKKKNVKINGKDTLATNIFLDGCKLSDYTPLLCSNGIVIMRKWVSSWTMPIIQIQWRFLIKMPIDSSRNFLLYTLHYARLPKAIKMK